MRLRNLIMDVEIDYERLQEIRLRVEKPLIVVYDNEEFFINVNARLDKCKENAFIVKQNELRETMEYISNYSLYAFEEEMRQGFITIQGGHRIGIAGKTVMEEEHVKNIRHISFINIRLSHQIKGCASLVIPYIVNVNENDIYDVLIISPPRCGKTTLLRDIVRQLSNGTSVHKGATVGVVDERSELGACYLGVPQNDLGIRTDILDCCPKAEGMMMMIRSMSPEVIAVDEIGSREDIESMEYAMNCGCKLIATVHGNCIDDIKNKPIFGELLKKRFFQRYIILNNKGGIGNIEEIYDERGTILYKKERMMK